VIVDFLSTRFGFPILLHGETIFFFFFFSVERPTPFLSLSLSLSPWLACSDGGGMHSMTFTATTHPTNPWLGRLQLQ
jgi:hypothetical protein